jgi:hypothetical protein
VDHPIGYGSITTPHVYNRQWAEHTRPHNNNVSTKNPSASEGTVDWKMTMPFVKHTEAMHLAALMNQHHAIMYIGLNDGVIKDAFGKWVARAWKSGWKNTPSWHVDKNWFHSR